jgi:hypothetical protein
MSEIRQLAKQAVRQEVTKKPIKYAYYKGRQFD